MIKILKSDEIDKKEILSREIKSYPEQEKTVRDIIRDVAENGDAAVRKYTKLFDGVEPDDFAVSQSEIDEAFEKVGKSFLAILKKAKNNIEAFHKKQIRKGFEIKKQNGIVLGQKFTPLESVGVYVPGGTASYPSTVLMNVVPAKIAGAKNIVMTTPPDKKTGKVKAEILAAAKIAGVDKIYKVGGAQAVAALAYGTETIPAVCKIVGPGNIFVAIAKKEVFGKVGIDMIAGPSEILILADKSANPDFLAADLLSQAEHDKLASAILVTDSEKIANDTAAALEKRLENLPRNEIASAAIQNNSKIILTKDMDEAICISDAIAPEHLELAVENPFETLEKVHNAGSIFLGHFTPEPLGDYFAGPNHTLPTNGSAKFSSPLSVDDFVKKSSYIFYSEQNLKQVEKDVAAFARREGLDAHAQAVEARSLKNE